jgi:hypothetical protein
MLVLDSIKLQNQVKAQEFCLNAESTMYDVREFKLPQRRR